MSTPKIIGTSHLIVQRDGQTYIAVDGMTPDQIIVWLHDHHRANAFGAIRRAAKVARGCDSVARYSLTTEPYREEILQRAYAVRLAIRAAIGSEKA